MKNTDIQCRYCKEKLPKSYMKDHIAFEHPTELKKTVKKLKIGLAISITFLAVSIGVTMGLIL